jgi:dolichol-phosphate mannosyltransferase
MVAGRVAVVIPSYRVAKQILDVISRIGDDVHNIYVVDDCCPDRSGRLVEEHCQDPRIRVIYHDANQGVGGAVLTGYQAACRDGVDVIVKLDGDGQMDPAHIAALVAPIFAGDADYAKGNRFFNMEDVKAMPFVRLIGNAGLSFLTKLSSGYWNLFDPTNGFTAIHARVAEMLASNKIAKRYFFESDMLFHLNTLHAVVVDVPMRAAYGDEESNLSVGRAIFSFAWRNAVNFLRRITYSYFLRDFHLASIELVAGAAATIFGIVFGLQRWIAAARELAPATSGTVMLSAMPIILGVQMLLGFLSYDISSVPRLPLHKRLARYHSDHAGRS